MTHEDSQDEAQTATSNATQELASIFDDGAAETIAARNRILVQAKGRARSVRVVGRDGEVKGLATHGQLLQGLYKQAEVLVAVVGRRPTEIMCADCKSIVKVNWNGVIPKRCRKCCGKDVGRPSTIVCIDCNTSVCVPRRGGIPKRCGACSKASSSAGRKLIYARDNEKLRERQRSLRQRRAAKASTT